MKFHPHNTEQLEIWDAQILKPLSERAHYTEQPFTYERIAVQVLGSYRDHDDYRDYLHMIGTEKLYQWQMLFMGMPKEIAPQTRNKVQEILQIHRETPLSANRMMAFFHGANLFPLKGTPYDEQYREAFKQWLAMLEERYPKLKAQNLHRFFMDLVKWSAHYFPTWIQDGLFENAVPRILWYGDARETDVYWLYFLYLYGCDIVVLHPTGDNIFAPYHLEFPIHRLEEEIPFFDFPFEKPQRIRTIAQKASEELQETIYGQDSLHYPWKYRDYEPQNRILQTTYDELFLLAPEHTHIRQGFEADKEHVYIPTLFAKIVGVSRDNAEYAERIQRLVRDEWTYTINDLPAVQKQRANMQFHYRDASVNGQLTIDKMIQLSVWPYKKLAIPLQKGLASAIIRLIEEAPIEKLPSETEQSYRHYLFGQALVIPERAIQLFQRFDYAYRSPTVVVFYEEAKGQLTREDAVLLKLLNMLGFDILLFNPTGQRDIEAYLSASFYDTHWLEEMSFDTTLESMLQQRTQPQDSSKIRTILKRFLN